MPVIRRTMMVNNSHFTPSTPKAPADESAGAFSYSNNDQVTAPTAPPKNKSSYGIVVKFRSDLRMTTILSVFEVRGSIVGKVEAARLATDLAADACPSSDLSPESPARLWQGCPLAPENAGWEGFDLVDHLVGGAGIEVVVAVPAAAAVGPVQAPGVDADAVAQLGHAHLGPFGQVRVPRRTAVEDGDRVASHGCFDADLAKAGKDPGSAVPAEPGDVGLRRRWHPSTLEP